MTALDKVLNGFPALLFTAGEHGLEPEQIEQGRAQIIQIMRGARAELDQLRAQLAALERQRAEMEALNLAALQQPVPEPQTDRYAWLICQSSLAEQIASLWRRYGKDADWNLRGLLPADLLAVLDLLERPVEEDGHEGA